jgi:uncharacterized damage-inducible protein DinB
MKPFLSLLLSLCYISVVAQNVSNEMLRQQLVKDWERAKAYTQEYLDAMPADKYSFRPVDSVRSFAEQMLHFAQSNVGMASIGTGYKNVAAQILLTPNFGKSPTAQNKDSVTYYMTLSYDFIIDAVENMDFGKLGDIVSWDMPGGRRSTTRLGWLLKAFEHQTHHRGQCTIYLRLVGIKPPAEKLWE